MSWIPRIISNASIRQPKKRYLYKPQGLIVSEDQKKAIVDCYPDTHDQFQEVRTFEVDRATIKMLSKHGKAPSSIIPS